MAPHLLGPFPQPEEGPLLYGCVIIHFGYKFASYIFVFFLSLNSAFKPHKTQIHYCALCCGHGAGGVFLCPPHTVVGRGLCWAVEGPAGWLRLIRPSASSWMAGPIGLRFSPQQGVLSSPAPFLPVPQPPDTVCPVSTRCLCL